MNLIAAQKLAVGDRVNSPSFGNGTVEEMHRDSVQVYFEGCNPPRVLFGFDQLGDVVRGTRRPAALARKRRRP
jgi:hypothetical protein